MYSYADKKEDAGRSSASAFNLSKQLKKNNASLLGRTVQGEGTLQYKWQALINNGSSVVKQRKAVPAVNTNAAILPLINNGDSNESTPVQKVCNPSPVYQCVKKISPEEKEKIYLEKALVKIKKDKAPDTILNKHLKNLNKGLETNRQELIDTMNKIKKIEAEKKKAKSKVVKNGPVIKPKPDRTKKLKENIKLHKRNITEVIGEWNATRVMQRCYPGAVLIYGYAKGTGLDQVWKDGSDIMVVEAKGPGAKLGMSDRKGKQMSENWIRETAKGMKNDEVSGIILKALDNNNGIKAMVVQSSLSGNAPQKPELLWKF